MATLVSQNWLVKDKNSFSITCCKERIEITRI